VTSTSHRFSTLPDLHDVAARMRKCDQDEVLARGRTPLDSLLNGYLHGDGCWTWDINGRPEAIYGVVRTSSSPNSAAIWLLGTDAIQANRRLFIQQSPSRIAQISAPYDVVWNFVDSRNSLHVRWLKHLGFTFIRETTDVSIDGTLFYEFAKLTHV
jgi:hypothetical protein